MEVFVKIIAEDLKSGDRRIAANALLTFVALDQYKSPTPVPLVIPETEEEIKLHETAPERAKRRMERKEKWEYLVGFLTTTEPWDQYIP
ncbi:hypothetical protein B4145_4599 [Bacillus subtilis]|uniref:Uncharacterized protein n=2 Tax=Bacillus subtilis TaxID=1423 RepID=A0ABD3ZX93_BACIU|nr:hypothetical protein B4067_4699 [Bacillus subtilis subsp. subtilis]KIN57467.1 hypothetical protein B4145_4599 [Bacillus subtilis]